MYKMEAYVVKLGNEYLAYDGAHYYYTILICAAEMYTSEKDALRFCTHPDMYVQKIKIEEI